MEGDNIDDDIERLQIVLKNDPDEEVGSEEELTERAVEIGEGTASYFSRPSTSSDVTAESSVFVENIATDDTAYSFDPTSASPETCLAMNQAYQEVLMDILRQTELALDENRRSQRQLEQDMEDQLAVKDKKKTGIRSLTTYAMPFFKDKDDRNPPTNDDVAIKKMLHEPKQHIKPPMRWTKHCKQQLTAAVKQDALEQLLRPLMCRLELEYEKLSECKSDEQTQAVEARIANIEQEMAEKKQIPPEKLLLEVDIDKVDWMKIAATKFPNRYDSSACCQMWKNVMSPLVNREKWTKEEEVRLFHLVEQHKMRDWEDIANELGNRRTPFQCLQYFQQRSCVFDQGSWTQVEDDLLKEVVDTCKVGSDNVFWNQVAYYIEGRSSEQCQKRWKAINPALRKGKWSEQEDCLLFAAVQMIGTDDWARVKEFVPGRVSNQCRERWFNCLCPSIQPKKWTYEEDQTLLGLVKKHGVGNWKPMVKEMPGKNENQLLHRFRRLMDWQSKMQKFKSMPKSVQKSLMGQLEDRIQNSSKRKKNIHDDLLGMTIIGTSLIELREDYAKQERDKKKGDIVVPRPPPTCHYSVRSFHSTWKRRENLRKLIEAQVERTVKELKGGEHLSDIATEATSNLNPITELPSGREKWEVVNSEMKGKRPHEISVREILEMSTKIAKQQVVKPPVKKAQPKKVKRVVRTLVNFCEHTQIGEKLRSLVQCKQGALKKPHAFGRGRPRKLYLWYKPECQIEPSEEEVASLKKKALTILMKTLDVDCESVVKKAVEDDRQRNEDAKEDTAEKTVRKSLRKQKSDSTNQWEEGRNSLLALAPSVMGGQRSSGGMQKDPVIKKTELEDTYKKISDALLTSHLGRPAEGSQEKLDTQIDNTSDRDKEGQERTDRHEESVIKSSHQATKEQNYTKTSQDGEKDSGTAVTTEAQPESSKVANGEREKRKVIESSKHREDEKRNENLESSAESMSKCQHVPFGTGSSATKMTGKNHKGSAFDVTSDARKHRLPFLPPSTTNLQGFQSLLVQRRLLIHNACEWGSLVRYYKNEDRMGNTGKTQLFENAISNVDKSVNKLKFKTRTSNKDDVKNDIERLQVLENIRNTTEYQNLKARFHSLFTWPALMATVKVEQSKKPAPCTGRQKMRKKASVDEKDTESNQMETDQEETNGKKELPLPTDLENVESGNAESIVNNILDVFKARREERQSLRKTKFAMVSSSRMRRRRNCCKEWKEEVVRRRERTKLINRLGLQKVFKQENDKPGTSTSVTENPSNVQEAQQAPGSSTEQTTPAVPVKMGPGRPVGSKTKVVALSGNIRRSGRIASKGLLEVERDTCGDDQSISSKKGRGRKRRASLGRNSILAEVIPEKMKKILPESAMQLRTLESPAPDTEIPKIKIEMDEFVRSEATSRTSMFSSPGLEINTQSIVFEETVQTHGDKGENSSRPSSQISEKGDNSRPESQTSVFIPPIDANTPTAPLASVSSVPLASPPTGPPTGQVVYYNAIVPGISQPVLVGIPAGTVMVQSGDGSKTENSPVTVATVPVNLPNRDDTLSSP